MPVHARQRHDPEIGATVAGSPDQVSLMADFPLQAPLTACTMLLFASHPTWDWPRRHVGPLSRNAVFLPFAVFVALTAISAIAAAAYALAFADVLNQFQATGRPFHSGPHGRKRKP
jgi:hypothetical protein